MKLYSNKITAGEIRALGASTRERTIAVLCADADGNHYALTGRDLHHATDIDPKHPLTGSHLLEAIPLAHSAQTPDLQPKIAGVARIWTDSLRRATKNGTSVQGASTAFRGLVSIHAGNKKLLGARLIEIGFDERDSNKDPTLIRPHDLGCLITMANGAPCAILIAGAAQTGYAVPLEEALNQLKLRVTQIPPAASSVALGLEAMRRSLSLSQKVDLGDMPLGEAA